MDVDEITPAELEQLLEDGDEEDLRIVDIRSPAAFAQGHVPGSENVPFRRLTTQVEEVADADRIVTVCPHGRDSVRAARLILAAESTGSETRVESLDGGLTAWDGPLEAGGGADGASIGDDDTGGPAAPF